MSETTGMCDPTELIALMRSGNIEALDRMTRCFGDRMMSMGRKYCGTDDRAQDAVQDALLAAGEHLTDFRGEGSVEGWLIRMVANACRRMQRGRKNDGSLHVDHSDLDAVSQSSPEHETARRQLADALDEAMLGIEPEDRVMLMLSAGEGWRAPELAAELETTPGAVRTRLSRARRRLRDDLGELWAVWGAPDSDDADDPDAQA